MAFSQDWRGAFLYGVDMFKGYPGREFDDVEPELSGGWNDARGTLTAGKPRRP